MEGSSVSFPRVLLPSFRLLPLADRRSSNYFISRDTSADFHDACFLSASERGLRRSSFQLDSVLEMLAAAIREGETQHDHVV